MIDLETLSTATDAAILSIGAVKFDPFSNETKYGDCDKFYVKVDLDSCNELNLSIQDSTIEWWANQSKEAQDEAFGIENRVHIKDAFDRLYKFCWGSSYVWSNGSGFDLVICNTIFNKLGKTVPWKYYQERDVRTYFSLGIDPKMPPKTAHHALSDAYAQAVGIQNVTAGLLTNGITPFTKG
jgi:DNA polymerase III epsilon subunit-like protein